MALKVTSKASSGLYVSQKPSKGVTFSTPHSSARCRSSPRQSPLGSSAATLRQYREASREKPPIPAPMSSSVSVSRKMFSLRIKSTKELGCSGRE